MIAALILITATMMTMTYENTGSWASTMLVPTIAVFIVFVLLLLL